MRTAGTEEVKLVQRVRGLPVGPLSFFDEEKQGPIHSVCDRASAGIDRSTLAFLVDAYDEEEVRGEMRNVVDSIRPLPR